VTQLGARARRALTSWVTTEEARLRRLTAASVLLDPLTPLLRRGDEVTRIRDRGRTVVLGMVERIDRDLHHRRAQLAALGPAAILARGYAVVQGEAGRIVRTVADAPPGTALRVRVADGAVLATSHGPEPGTAVDDATGQAAGQPAIQPAIREVSR
jgi:exodeoxyribonuclease VII large subunit